MIQILVKVVTIILIEFAIFSCLLLPDGLAEALAIRSSPLEHGRNYRENKLLIIGLGRVGLQVADLAIEKAIAQVFGTVRESMLEEGELDDGENAQMSGGSKNLVQVPFDPVVVRKHLCGCEERNNCNENHVLAASHVLFTIPLSRETDPTMDAVLNELREWWLLDEDGSNGKSSDQKNIRCQSKVLGILSTTGIYGNHCGKVVTEHSQLFCEESSNAELYRKFEDDWISSSQDDVVKDGIETTDKTFDTRRSRRLRIFRCAGIYDSSRSALHTVYKQLSRSSKAPRNLSSLVPTTMNKTNRIHSIDLARGVLSGMFQEMSNIDEEIINSKVRIYNLADDLPEARSVVISHAQDLLASIGIDQGALRTEQFTTATTKTSDNLVAPSKRSSTSRQKRRERESKLVCNKRMKKELFPDDGLLFPTYREGLHAIFNDPITPWRQ